MKWNDLIFSRYYTIVIIILSLFFFCFDAFFPSVCTPKEEGNRRW